MKANEFVKKYGFEETQRVVRKAEIGATIYVLGNVPFYDVESSSDHVVLDDLRHFVKACEFIKKFGWERVVRCTNQSSRDNFFICDGVMIRDNDLDELKRLVASHGIVQSKGGLKKAKEYLSKKHILAWNALDGQLSQAVKDVEACNA